MFKSLPAGSNVGDIFKLKPEARRAGSWAGSPRASGPMPLTP